MKKFYFTVLTLCLIFLLVACGAEEVEALSVDPYLVDDVTLTLHDDIYTADFHRMEFTISNESTFEITVGFNHAIDYFNGQAWEEIPQEVVAGNIAQVINPNATSVQELSLSHFSDLSPGRYRLRVSVRRDTHHHDLVAEFILIHI